MAPPSARHRPHPHVHRFALVLFLVCSTVAIACSSGGGKGGGTGAAGTTGSVAVLLTDGPVDPGEFQHIYVTYTEIILIGDGMQQTIFRGRKTIDLREFEDAGKLVTIGRRVKAGIYEKIRLIVSRIELVPADGGPSIFPKLPPKLDLNPRDTLRVRAGRMLVVQLDMDAGKAIHIVATGSGMYIFRSVVFVDVIQGAIRGKLILLRGVVEEVDPGGGSFLLCDTHPVSRPLGSDRVTEDERDDASRDDFCIQVLLGGDTSIFDEDGNETSADAIMAGDAASVLGRFTRDGEDHDEDLVFDAEVVQLGDGIIAVDGVVQTEVDADDRFLLDLDPGQAISTDDGTLLIQLQDGTRIFSRRGDPLDRNDIQIDDRARAAGVLSLSSQTDDQLKAAFVVIDLLRRLSRGVEGEIVEVTQAGARIVVDTGDTTACVNVPSTARVLLVDDDAGTAEPIPRSDLAVGDRVSAFGVPGSCLDADTVIVFTSPEPEPLSAFSTGGFATSQPEDEEDAAAALQHDGALGLALPPEPMQAIAPQEAEEAPDRVQVLEAGPRRVESGLIWVKLPGDDSAEASPAASER